MQCLPKGDRREHQHFQCLACRSWNYFHFMSRGLRLPWMANVLNNAISPFQHCPYYDWWKTQSPAIKEIEPTITYKTPIHSVPILVISLCIILSVATMVDFELRFYVLISSTLSVHSASISPVYEEYLTITALAVNIQKLFIEIEILST